MILVIIIGPFRIISDLTHPQIILGVTTVLMFLSKSWYGNIKTIDNYSYWYSYVSIAIACCVAEKYMYRILSKIIIMIMVGICL
eukprot:UN00146